MNRREFVATSSFGLAGLAVVPAFARGFGGQAAQTPPPAATSFNEIRGGVGYFSGRGGTIGYLITGDGAIAVDSQFPDTAATCVEGLKQKAPKGIELLINTHHHGDHTGGNTAFKPVVKRIVCQEKCLEWHKKTAESAAKPTPQAYADVTFGESWSATLGSEKVWAYYHGTGHTSGDAVIVFEKANVVHMGDLMFNRMHPRLDLGAGGSARNWIRVLDAVAKKHSGATFIFGHAKAGLPVTGPAKELLYFRDYLSRVVDTVEKAVKSKQSKEELQKMTEIAGFPDHASSGQVLTIAGILGTVYDEIAK
jgi:glyoxylase-like metal-dependent hydrolase (beta-lactamase superfamily II)